MKKLMICLAVLVAVFLFSVPAQAMSWTYPITEVELRPLDTTPIEYPVYVDVINPWGVRVPQHDGVTPNGWVISNRDIASYGQMADAWMQQMGLYDKYELVLVDYMQVELPYIWPATPDAVGRREYTAIVITLKPLPDPTETAAPAPTQVVAQAVTIAPAPVQLPATGESDAAGLFAAALALVIIGVVSGRRM